MFIIRLNLIHVDYDNIAERFLPDLFKNVSEDSKFSTKVANELLVNNKLTNGIAKGMLRILPQQAKDKIAFDLINSNKDKIIESANKYLEDNQIGIRIAKLYMLETNKAVKGMLKLEVVLQEIDYKSVVVGILPKLLKAMAEKNEKTGALAKVLLDMKEAPIQMITAALNVISQEQLDELVMKLFEIYNEDIIDGMNQMATEQQISAVISEIKLEATM